MSPKAQITDTGMLQRTFQDKLALMGMIPPRPPHEPRRGEGGVGGNAGNPPHAFDAFSTYLNASPQGAKRG